MLKTRVADKKVRQNCGCSFYILILCDKLSNIPQYLPQKSIKETLQ